MKTIAVVGALDTKGLEFGYLRAEIERHGCRALMVDVGVLGAPALAPEVGADEVARAGGSSLAELRSQGDRGAALDVMARGVAVVARRLFEEGRFQAMVSMGGGGGTGVATSAMRALPVGVPKVMVSTLASGDVAPYVGTSDIVMMPAVVDVAGLNRVSRVVFTHAAAAVCGMAEAGRPAAGPGAERPLVAASMFGNTTRAVDHARALLEARGYEVLVFHATGTGGRTMEALVEAGYFAGVLDITTTEWADELCGGVLSAGPTRLDAAGRLGVPQVVTPGCIDMCNFWAADTVPARYRDRRLHSWSPNVTLMRTTPEENARMGRIFGEKLSAARGPVAVLVPTRGYSELDAPGKPFWWPEADQAFVEALRGALRADIPLVLVDHNVNDPEFSGKVAETLLRLLDQKKEA